MWKQDSSFKKSKRLRAGREFQQVYLKGQSVVDAMSVWYICRGNPAEKKIGLAVGKKLGCAVMRNHAKRLMREVFRKHQNRLKEGWHIVWVARQKLICCNLPTYERVFFRMAKKAGLLKEER